MASFVSLPMSSDALVAGRRILSFTVLTLIAFVISIASHAQVAELNGQMTALEGSVVGVQSGSKQYEQKISFHEPARVVYSFDEIDQKGNRTNYRYEFNLADIDPYAVREQTQKDLISVVLAARNKQKLIKVYKNEVVQAYDDQVAIIARDIENARAISDAIKKGLPHAEKIMASRLKLSGYDAMIVWLTTQVKDVNLGDKSIKQSLSKGEDPGSLTYTRVVSDAKASTEEVFVFNLSDVNVNAIGYKITGNQFSIGMETLQKSRYVGVRKNGELKPYVNEIILHTNNPDEARDLKNVLSEVVPLAFEKLKGSMPGVSTEKDGLQKLTALTGDIASGDKVMSQSWEGDCLAGFTQVEKDSKGSKKEHFGFNWMDVNPLASKIDVSGDKLFIDLIFNEEKKLMMHTVDDEFKGYDNRMRLYMTDIEDARKAKFLIDRVIEKCKASYKEPFGSDAKSAGAYFQNQVKDLSLDDLTLRQSLESVEEGTTKYKYTVIEVNPKGSSVEQVYEFNLADINPTSIGMDVKGKWLYVALETEYKGKIIKYYKDGKIQPYTHTLQIAINDLTVARNVVSALNKAVSGARTGK